MIADADDRTLFSAMVRDFRRSWKSLFLTDIAFKILAFVVLTPLTGMLFRGLLAISGKTVLSDVDIVFFFLGPWGWFCLLVVGGIWLGIVALEQASLTAIVCSQSAQQPLSPLNALRFAAVNAGRVIRVTSRMVALTLVVVAPFLAVAAVVFFNLLTKYDINYYLKEKPPVFVVAAGIGVVLALVLVALLLRLFTSWFFALPLVLFENFRPSDALRVSAQRVRGHRRTLLLWILGWLLGTFMLSTAATMLVGILRHVLVPGLTGSLYLLAVAVGIVILLTILVGLVVNLLSTTTFSVILFQLYRRLGRQGLSDEVQVALAETTAGRAWAPMTGMRVVLAGIIGGVVALAFGVFALRSVRLDDRVLIMAHRGSSKAAPENTMAAVRQAIEDGAEWVEIDVQETVDGEVVVFHDSDFMKVANLELKIWDATTDDLRDVDIGSWFAPEFKGERVATLAEVLKECRGKIGVNIELKYYGHDEQLEQRVAEIVDAHQMASEVVVMSLKIDGVRKMKSIRPEWRVGLLMSVAVGNVQNIEADFLAVNASLVNRRLIRSAHDDGKEIYVWTVNDAPTMSMMISRGVDGLLTDKPALARSVLAERAQMSVPERLLLELAGALEAKPEIADP